MAALMHSKGVHQQDTSDQSSMKAAGGRGSSKPADSELRELRHETKRLIRHATKASKAHVADLASLQYEIEELRDTNQGLHRQLKEAESRTQSAIVGAVATAAAERRPAANLAASLQSAIDGAVTAAAAERCPAMNLAASLQAECEQLTERLSAAEQGISRFARVAHWVAVFRAGPGEETEAHKPNRGTGTPEPIDLPDTQPTHPETTTEKTGVYRSRGRASGAQERGGQSRAPHRASERGEPSNPHQAP
eukprot:gene30180-35164_t